MRSRDVLAALIGVAVVGLVAYLGWIRLADSLAPAEAEAEPGRDPQATLEAYLAAWADDDLAAMEALVRRPPEDFAARHRQLSATLQPTARELVAGPLLSPVDGRANAPVTLSFELPEAPHTLRWDTELTLVRERGVWAVDWAPTTIHPELRETWGFARTSDPVERQPILAADGTPLAGGGPAVTFGFRAGSVTDPGAVIGAFARALPGSESAAERELARSDLNDDWFYPVVTVSQARAQEVAEQLPLRLGILSREDSSGRALYDVGFARHVVGIVSEATAEQLEELGPDVTAGTPVAQFGLEAAFDDQLTGSERVRYGLRALTDDDGPLLLVLGEGQEDPSAPLRTTLEVDVQRAVERALGGVEGAAALVVVDGETGAVVASASRPLGGYHRAFAGRFPPGSTFKIVTAEALLASGVAPDEEVACPATTTVGGLRVRNAEGRDLGTVDLTMAFAASCNTTFATLGAALGGEALGEAAQRFGFGLEPRLPLDAYGASFPPPVDTAEVAAAAFGQARVEASPLHLASIAAATVSGVWHPPYLIVDDGPGEGRPLASGTLDALQELMRRAVVDGTGSAAAAAGREVRGKTGTAQAAGGREHAWFVGTVDGLGFAVLVEDGGSGAEVAAPLALRFVEALGDHRAQPEEGRSDLPAPGVGDPAER